MATTLVRQSKTLQSETLQPDGGRHRKFRNLFRRKPAHAPFAPVMVGYTGDAAWTHHYKLSIALLAFTAFLYGGIFSLFGTYVLMQLIAPLVIIMGFIVWLLPDTGHAPVRMLDKLLIAFLAVVICWPNYLALALPGMPWITMIRLVAAPLAIVMLVCLSTSEYFRKELRTVLAAAPLIWKMLVAFMILAFLSIGVSQHMGNSINKFIVAQLYWTLIFFSSCYVFSKPGRAVALVHVLWIGLIIVALLGVQEWRHKVVPWAGHVPSFLKVSDETLQKMMTSTGRKATGVYRVKSVFTTPLGLSEYLAICTPFMIHMILTAKRASFRIAAIASIVLAFYVITKTDSRLGIVGFFLSFLMYPLAWGALHWRNNPGKIVGPVIVLTYPAVFCAFVTASLFIRRLHVMMFGGGAQQASSDARKFQIAKGIPQILSHPWGYGIGESGVTLHYANQAGVFSIDTYYLSIGLEYGVVGFIIYYGMFIAGVTIGSFNALHAKSDETKLLIPLAISMIIFLIIKSVFSQESNHPIAFAMLGTIVALVYRVRQENQPTSNSRVRKTDTLSTSSRVPEMQCE